ncbi:nucleolin-like [Triticum aestivum]|uniref:nucleolin-like n=1 Tax=Triticum aestivum TaxID=4565 RepID=UPI001D0334F1|nr:nucleolin-like [Triticum aestivum]
MDFLGLVASSRSVGTTSPYPTITSLLVENFDLDKKALKIGENTYIDIRSRVKDFYNLPNDGTKLQHPADPDHADLDYARKIKVQMPSLYLIYIHFGMKLIYADFVHISNLEPGYPRIEYITNEHLECVANVLKKEPYASLQVNDSLKADRVDNMNSSPQSSNNEVNDSLKADHAVSSNNKGYDRKVGHNKQVLAADPNEQTVENESEEVKGYGGVNDDDVAVKGDVTAQNANDNAANNQDNEAGGGEMDAEQEEKDHEEVVLEDLAGERQDTTEVEEEEDHARVEKDEQMVMSEMAKNRHLKKELEIFVRGLDREAVKEDIRKVFGQVGDVVEVRLHKDCSMNKNKGFACVKFASKEQVARAIAVMNNPVLNGKQCCIGAREDNDTLFLGNICNTWTEEAIKKRLNEYGIQGVESLTLVPDTPNEGKNRGFAFLEFSCHGDVMIAFERLQEPDVVFGHPERTAKVAFAEPIKETDAEVMYKAKSVSIDGLPPYWDEDRVKDRFKAYGLLRVVLACDMSSVKRNGFGFLYFSTHEEALACIEAINNTELGDDAKLKEKVRVRLSNPLRKSKAVKGGMSGGFRIGHSGPGFNMPDRSYIRGESVPCRAGFHGGRDFNNHAPSCGGRYNSASNNDPSGAPPSDFRACETLVFRDRLPIVIQYISLLYQLVLHYLMPLTITSRW